MLYDVAAEEVVVSQLAVAEGKDDGRNSMAVGDMEDPAVVVMAHSLSVGCTGNCRHGIVHVLPDSVEAVEAAGAVVVAALEKGVVLVKALEFEEA